MREKTKFFEGFDNIISAAPAADKLIILDDFSTRVRQDSAPWEGVLGKHVTGICHSNGRLLLQTCAKHNLHITNTLFCLPTRNKTSWMHHRSKIWHLIDYIIVRRRVRWDVRVTRTVCGAECWTGHCIIISKLSIRVQPNTRPQGKKTTKATRYHEAKRRSNRVIICWGLRWEAWYNPFGRPRRGSSVNHSPGHHIEHSYGVFRTIYQKTQRLVWWEPCRDHGPHWEKARCRPGIFPQSSVYYQERRSKEYLQNC